MLGYLRGQLLENGVSSSSDGKLIVGIGSEAHGFVGYSVSAPRSAAYEFLPVGKSIELFIYTHVREDSLDLFGFSTRVEKELFLTLLSVNGIGPKGALSILSGSEPLQLVQAIVDGDKAMLTQVPGVGKKTAERVVLELADPLRKKLEAGVFGSTQNTVATKEKAASNLSTHDLKKSSQSMRDAVSALVGLGFREGDVTSLVSRVLAGSETAPRTEELVRLALRQLS